MSLISHGHAPSRQASAEVLRAVLAKMGVHADTYGPESYAVFYEYVRGSLPDLRDDCDRLFAAHGRLSETQTAALHERYLQKQSEAALAKAKTGLLALLAQVQAAVDLAMRDALVYDRSLGAFEEGVTHDRNIDDLKNTLEKVVTDTREMRESMTTLTDEIVGNRSELDRLTAELNRLREDVLIDPLTTLMNRRGLDAALAALKCSIDDGADAFSIIMIDIDRFKVINDTHGHLVGDRVIQQVAAAMKSCVRGGDIAARYGGEEFVLLLPSTALKGAQTVAEYVRKAIERTPVSGLKNGAPAAVVTVSAGVTEYRAAEDVDACLSRADTALYAAKSGGRNQVRAMA